MSLARARSIRRKLNVIVTATTLVALVVAGAALLWYDLRTSLETLEQDLVTQGDVIALASAPALSFADPRVAAENLAVLRARPGVTAAALYDDKGRLFASFTPSERGGRDLPVRAEAPSLRLDGDWAMVWRPVVANRETIGSLYLQVRHDRLRQLFEYLAVMTVIIAGSLGAALLLSNRLQRSVTGPILDVSAVAQQILRGQTGSLRAHKTSDDEVGALVDAFNAMLDELGRRAQTLEEANDALRASETRYQLAVRGSSAGLWDWDIPAGTMFFSPRFKALLGYTQEEFPDLPEVIGRIIHDDDRAAVRAALQGHFEHHRPYQVECRLRDRSGQWRWFFVAGAAQWDDAGKPFRMAGSVVEVTERKQAEQVLQEANRAKDEFLATLAHELRNPLAPIRTGLEILKKDRSNGAASERARATMERQLAHMIRLIDDLLDISRINSGKILLEIGRVGLAEVIDTALDISRPTVVAGNHELKVEVPERDIELMGDPTRLAQALGNLLNNAAKYTPPGGHLFLRARQEQDEAVIEVEDDGVGIPEDMLETVFSLFAQVGKTIERSQGGLGIGLYLVRSLVTLHGGCVTARSPGPGKGSVFTVRLPCLPRTADGDRRASAPSAATEVAGLKVLLVDDNVDAADTLGVVLEMSGCQVRTVHDGPSVLGAAEEFGPHVVLLDIGLPGMNGYEVAVQLRQHPGFRYTRLIALTGWGGEQDRRRAQEAGFDHHLTKPVDFGALEPLLRAPAAPAAGR